MINLFGFWTSVTLIIIPPFFFLSFIVIGITETYLEDVSNRVYKARLAPKFESFCERVEDTLGGGLAMMLFAVGLLGALMWAIAFAVAGLAYFIDDISTDFVGMVALVAEDMAPFTAWAIIVTSVLIAIHLLLKNFFKIVKKIEDALK